MTSDLDAALDVLDAVSTALRACIPPSGSGAADLYWTLGDLAATAESRILGADLGGALAGCFAAATAAGATFDGMAKVQSTTLALSPDGELAVLMQAAAARCALIEMANIVAVITPASRQDVERYLSAINAGFSVAEEVAADAQDSEVYAALIGLHGAVTRYLTTVSWTLPSIVTYRLPAPMPALTLAGRLYGDAARFAELVAENPTPHPLFMPATGRALSA